MSSKKLSEQVALLEDARDFYRTARDELIDDNSTLQADLSALDQDRHRLLAERAELETERVNLQRQVQEARDERDVLRAGQGRWPRLGPAVAPTVPRVISADELCAGMVVAWKVKDHHWGAGEVYDDGADALSEIRGITHIVLLEDAPQPERKRPRSMSFGSKAYHSAIYADGEVVENSDVIPDPAATSA